jgi:hypothetical protein
MLEVRVALRVERWCISLFSWERVWVRAVDWDSSGGMAVADWLLELWRVEVRRPERWERRASFSGLRGIGGAGGGVEVTGRAMSKGEERRSG